MEQNCYLYIMKTFSGHLRAFCLMAGMLAFAVSAAAWGQKGHDVTCAIAQKHLTKKAQKHISEALDGKSLVYWANWLDNASHTPEYAYTKTWHYKNIDANETFETAAENENGDVVTAINSLTEALKSGKLNKEQEALDLKMLAHLVGDMHQPMHMGHKSDLGGNKWQIQYFGKGRNLHSIWDSAVLEDGHKWTHTEWVEEIDILSKDEAAKVAAGTPADWAKETYGIATAVYDGTPVGSQLSYDYVSEWTPVIEQQLLRAGLRLAALLNEIYR